MFEFLQPRNGPVVDGLEGQELVYAADQPQYIPLRVLRGSGDQVPVLSRWTLTPEQRKAVAEGADIFLELSVFKNQFGQPNPLQPIRMAVSDASNNSRLPGHRERFMDWFKVCLLNQPVTAVEMHDDTFTKSIGIKL